MKWPWSRKAKRALTEAETDWLVRHAMVVASKWGDDKLLDDMRHVLDINACMGHLERHEAIPEDLVARLKRWAEEHPQ